MGKVALLFPGQGAQFVGMGREYVDANPRVEQLWDRAADVLGYDLKQLCFEGPEAELNTTAIAQPAMFVASMTGLEAFRGAHPKDAERVEAAAGLSLGEYTALAYAGAVSFEDGLRLVSTRGRLMQEAAEATAGGMVSVMGLDEADVRALCKRLAEHGPISVANLNCPGQVVVSGADEACRRVEQEAEAAGASRVIRLTVAGAFHSALMASAGRELADVLEGVSIQAPRLPVLSNVSGTYHGEAAEIRESLVRQVTSPVLWERDVRQLLADGFDRFYEVGPGRVLTGLMRRIERRVECRKI